MTYRPIIDAGPGLNFFAINKERLLIGILGQLSAPETVQDEVFRKSQQELCRRYSNRPDLLGPLVSVLGKIKNGVPHDDEPDLAPVRGNEAGVWRIADRLSPSDVSTLIESYRAGSTARLLAERYSVITATVKRLLHEHGVRKQRSRAVA